MKNIKLAWICALVLLWPLLSYGQGENSIWTFSETPGGASHKTINFNAGVPSLSLTTLSLLGPYSEAVCYPNGQLRFYVSLTYNTPSSPPILNIFAANGVAVPGSNLRTGMLDEQCMPTVVPYPGNSNRYYIFYSYSKALLYSLLDMSLNNGSGGIVPGQKDVPITPYGTIVAQKMTAIKGCNGVWLVVRSRISNGYLSFHITRDGIYPDPVESEAGLFPFYNELGFLKASPDGRRLALAGYYGVELYSFEKCSGKVIDLGVIDTTGNHLPPAQSIFNYDRFNGVCFSPDNSKLYVSYNVSRPGYNCDSGKLYQFDLSIPEPAAITASKTLVLTNIRSIIGDISACIATAPNPLGEIKMGLDQKLYVDNGSATCRLPGNVPPSFNPGPGFHVINQPNLAGMACGPQLNVIDLSLPNSYGGDFYKGGDGGRSYLQQDIVVADPPADTVAGNTFAVTQCFKDSAQLEGNQDGQCFYWDNGTTARQRSIQRSGIYYVSYFKDCNYTTDTFKVRLIRLPRLSRGNIACPGMHMGLIVAGRSEEDTSTMSFVWKDAAGSVIRRHLGLADTLNGVDPGYYSLQLGLPGFCDTVINTFIDSYPAPVITTEPADTTVRYGDTITFHAYGAVLYSWWPTSALDTATKAFPVARPLQPTVFSVRGINEFGCADTGYVRINIDYSMPDMLPNAFSPNGDGQNDVFRLEGLTYQKINVFSVFNRFGQQVFRTDDSSKGWDGTQNGKPCDVGTYYYLLQVSYPDGSIKTKRGDVLLIR